ncbi:hypothetical protein HDU97_002909 [Phlyctochytrium planicorne]|nr:hypothetical protein HDU97_002909 [Phlyctochytrium planicorne]
MESGQQHYSMYIPSALMFGSYDDDVEDGSGRVSNYDLELVQQPLQARISRSSLKDRRTVDPPPIGSQLPPLHPSSGSKKGQEPAVEEDDDEEFKTLKLRAPFLVVHASLLVPAPNSTMTGSPQVELYENANAGTPACSSVPDNVSVRSSSQPPSVSSMDMSRITSNSNASVDGIPSLSLTSSTKPSETPLSVKNLVSPDASQTEERQQDHLGVSKSDSTSSFLSVERPLQDSAYTSAQDLSSEPKLSAAGEGFASSSSSSGSVLTLNTEGVHIPSTASIPGSSCTPTPTSTSAKQFPITVSGPPSANSGSKPTPHVITTQPPLTSNRFDAMTPLSSKTTIPLPTVDPTGLSSSSTSSGSPNLPGRLQPRNDEEDDTIIHVEGKRYRLNRKVFVGTLTSQSHLLADPDGRLGCFFAFPDLSVRSSGNYRLKFDLFDLSRTIATGTNKSLATVVSSEFHVYSPQNFPGMAASTPFTQCFSKQGVKIIRRYDLK